MENNYLRKVSDSYALDFEVGDYVYYEYYHPNEGKVYPGVGYITEYEAIKTRSKPEHSTRVEIIVQDGEYDRLLMVLLDPDYIEDIVIPLWRPE